MWNDGREPFPELIDTLWNVNQMLQTIALAASRINRYIMECKCSTIVFFVVRIWELIDTLWNVNGYLPAHRVQSAPELIDTLWNVNVRLHPIHVIKGLLN